MLIHQYLLYQNYNNKDLIKNDYYEIIKYLIDTRDDIGINEIELYYSQDDIDLKKGDKHNNTFLILICRYGHLNILEYLIKNYNLNIYANPDHFYINNNNIDSHTFNYACYCGYLNIIKYLVKKSGGFEYLHQSETHLLSDYIGHYLTQAFRYIEVVKYLIEDCCNQIDIREAALHYNNDSPLIHACNYGHLDVVKYLVSHGADIHARNNKSFLDAYRYNNLDIVKYLVAQEANERLTS